MVFAVVGVEDFPPLTFWKPCYTACKRQKLPESRLAYIWQNANKRKEKKL